MATSAWQEWFESAWADREDNVFPRLFGSEARGIFTLSPDLFLKTFKQPSFDPTWLHYGVFEFQPTAERSSWLYVTSGMSNAWDDEEPQPDGPSGFGSEFVFETPEQGNWAIIRVQQLMAFQILLVHGRYPDLDPLAPYDRMPLRGSITPEPSELSWLILAPPTAFAGRHQLASGWFEFDQVFGATEDEAAFAREHGGAPLVEILTRCGGFPVTDPRRTSAVVP